MPTYPVLRDLTYRFPTQSAVDPVPRPGLVGQYFLAAFNGSGSGTNISTAGSTFEYGGDQLKVRLNPSTGGSYYRVSYRLTPTDIRYVDVSVNPTQIVEFQAPDKYTRSHSYGDMPSEEFLMGTQTFTWEKHRTVIESEYVPFATGPVLNYEFPDPGIYNVRLIIQDSFGGESFVLVGGVSIDEDNGVRSAISRSNRNLEFNALQTVQHAQVMPQVMQPNGTKVAFLSGEVDRQLFPGYKSPYVWESVTGQVYIAITKGEIGRPNETTELWRSDDRLGSVEKVAEIWDGNYRGAATINIGNPLAPDLSCSAAIKTGSTPSQVYFKFSYDSVSWGDAAPSYSASQPSFMVYVGDLPSDSKEPLNLIYRDGKLEILAGNSWRSTDLGRTWEEI
jgi:hypothetical protein